VEVLDLRFLAQTGSPNSNRLRPTGGFILLAALFIGQLAPQASEQKLETYSGVGNARSVTATIPSTWTSSLSGTFAYAKLYGPPAQDVTAIQSVIGRRGTGDPADELRRLTALPVNDLAKLVGVSRVAYHDWLKGRPIALQKARVLLQVLAVIREAAHGRDQDSVRRWIVEPIAGSRVSPFSLIVEGKIDYALGLALLSDSRSSENARTSLDTEAEGLVGVAFNQLPRVRSRGFATGVRQPAYLIERSLSNGWRDDSISWSPDGGLPYTEHEL
jgi:hypothetical protein